VHKTELLQNKALFAPLPLSRQYLRRSVGRPSPSGPATPAATLQNVLVTLPPPIGTTSDKNEELRPCQNEDSDVTNAAQGTKRPTTDDSPCGPDLKKSHVDKEPFPPNDSKEDKELSPPKDSEKGKDYLGKE